MIQNLLANGAMGLGLERWDTFYWAIYVIAMVGLEALLIGCKLGFSWPQSILRSLLANAFTGSVCGLGFCSPVLHMPFAGNSPFLDAIVVLHVFALPTALVETFFWKVGDQDRVQWQGFWRVILVHFALVPVALCILLIPDKPYRGTQDFIIYRQHVQRKMFAKNLHEYVRAKHQLPATADIRELIRIVNEFTITTMRKPDQAVESTCFDLFEFNRFSFNRNNALGYEMNPKFVGKRFRTDGGSPEVFKWEWYLRSTTERRRDWSIYVELSTGYVRESHSIPDSN